MSERDDFSRLVSPSAERVGYKAGEVIIKEGDEGDRMYILASGRARIAVRNHVLEQVEAGGVFGEMALIDGGRRGATVSAETDCEVVPVDAKRFEFMVRQTPFFAIQLMRIMSRRLRAMNEDGHLKD